MDFALSQQQAAVRDAFRRLVDEKIAPRARDTVYLLREGTPQPRALDAKGAILLGASSQGMALLTSPALNSGVPEGTLSMVPLSGGGPREVSRTTLAADFAADGSGLCLVTRASRGQGWQLEWPQGVAIAPAGPNMIRNPRVREAQVAFFLATVEQVSNGEIRVAARGEAPRSLVRRTGFTALAWGPRGDEIWFSTYDGGESRIEAVSLRGRTRLLARHPGRLELMDVDRAGRCLAIGSSELGQAFGRAPGAEREVDLTWLEAQTPRGMWADGSQVLLSNGDWGMADGTHLYLRPLDGGPAVDIGSGSLNADLSQDGRWAVTFETDPKEQAGLRLIPTGAGTSRWYPLTGRAANADALWFQPEGGGVYLLSETTFALSRLDLATGAITPGSLPGLLLGYNVGNKPLSPNGKRMVFSDQGSAPADDNPFHFLVFDGLDARPTPARGNLRTEVVAGWADDNQEIYLYDRNAIPADVVRWNPLTGTRRPFLRIAPADPSGVWGINYLNITPSGHAYAYSVLRRLSDLYVIEGLK